jgi:superfamily I DNA/RNA helicase
MQARALQMPAAGAHNGPQNNLRDGINTMATLIPALGAYVSRMTSGERRLGERLEQKIDDDYLLWYDVPVGAKVTDMVECSQMPSGQYQAVMIDEGHDFAPEWLKLITQMVDPRDQQPAGAV